MNNSHQKAVKTFRVFVLGTSGSGKTTLLASMYKRLSVQQPEIGFFLEIGDAQRKFLVNQYRELADPDLDWPIGTQPGDLAEWRFTCTHASGKRNIRVFEFEYLDYAGGLITEGGIDNPTNFQVGDAAKDADAVLVLIDGQKPQRSLNAGSHDASRSLIFDLDHILPIVQRLENVPFHFAITKWDVLDPHWTLDDIRHHLSRISPKFRVLVNRRRRSTVPTHLIPVSALGQGFAFIDERGFMVKSPNAGPPVPFQVELPLACTLIDGFEIACRSLADTTATSEPRRKRLRLLPLLILRTILRLTNAEVSRLAPPWNISWTVARPFLRALGRKVEHRQVELENQIERCSGRARDQSSAVALVISKHAMLTQNLANDFPGSNLREL